MKAGEVKRVWVNQPSTAQEFHHLHGKHGLIFGKPDKHGFTRIYFCTGDLVSQEIRTLALEVEK